MCPIIIAIGDTSRDSGLLVITRLTNFWIGIVILEGVNVFVLFHFDIALKH